jgi:hypothetical protein
MALRYEEWPTGMAKYGYIYDSRDLLVKQEEYHRLLLFQDGSAVVVPS